MKRRILSEIHLLASEQQSKYLENLCKELKLSEKAVRANAEKVQTGILHDYSRFTILTIDRFFQRIIRAFIHELGLDVNYNIELDPSTILTQSADRIIEQMEESDELKRWISEFIEERIEDGKGWNIQEGILSLSGEIFKESNHERLENPTSKERLKEIISSYRARSEVARNQIKEIGKLALGIISNAGLTCESFSGKSRSFTKYFEQIAQGVIKEPTSTQRDRATSCEGWGRDVEHTAQELRPLLEQAIALYDSNLKLWNTTDLLRENYRSFALLSDLYSMVKQVCNEQNMMLLSETKLILSEFITEEDAPFIYEKVGNRFERYMIDEFQDTSLKEWNNFLPLLQNAMSQSNDNSVLIVGDIKQSIYRWRGGDWRILHSMARENLGEHSTEIVNLKDNYRSLPNIVEFNNEIIASVVESDNKLLNDRLKEARENKSISQQSFVELRDLMQSAYSDHSQTPRKGSKGQGYIDITLHDDEPDIIGRIKSVLDLGFRPCEILILVRSNNDGIKIANTLLEFKARNTVKRYYFDVMTQEALIVDSAPISQFIIATFKLALEPNDDIARTIYNHYLSRESICSQLTESDIKLLNRCRELSSEEAFENIVIHHHLSAKSDEVAYLQAIHESICGFCSSKSGDISLFLKWWEEHGSKRSISVEQSDFSIEITTIHKAKGLEKAVVMIPYCTWSLEPKSSGAARRTASKPISGNAVWAEAQDELSELGAFPIKYKNSMGQSLFSDQFHREAVYSHIDNINMLYVALTRASQALHLFIKRGASGVGKAIQNVINANGDRFAIGSISGRVVKDDETISYIIGEQAPSTEPREQSDDSLCIMESYPTAKADLRLRLPSERYFDKTESNEALTPRSQGVLLHKVFAESSTQEDIFERLTLMTLNGQISLSEQTLLKAKIHEALENPIINEWFSSEWEQVRNEHDIIIPRAMRYKRPDRVMTKGDRAIVLDYKFGLKQSDEHKKQVSSYMYLLSQMGYKQIEGYLWYIKNGTIVTVLEGKSS